MLLPIKPTSTVTSTPGSGPTYLPTIASGTLQAVYSASSLEIAAYAGPLMRIVQPSNQSNTLDLYANPSTGLLDVSGVATFLGSDTYGEIDTIYNQLDTGIGATTNKTQATQSLRSWLLLTNAVNGMYSITTGGVIAGSTQRTSLPTTVSTNGKLFSCFRISKMLCTSTGAFYSIGANDFTAGSAAYWPGNTGSNSLGGTAFKSAALVSGGGGNAIATSSRSRSQIQVSMLTSSASARVLYQDGDSYTFSANSAGTVTGGVDYTIDTNQQWNGEDYLDVRYTTVVNPTDYATLRAYANTKWPNAAGANAQLVWPGTSVTRGLHAFGLHNMQYYLETSLSRPIEIYNMGVSGQTVQSMYTNRAYYMGMFRGDRTYNLAISGEPSNDINNLPNGGIVGQGTVIYNTYTLPLIQALIGAGFTVAVPTTPPLLFSGTAPDQLLKDQERIDHNNLVIANAAAQGYTVLDYAGVPQAQVKTNTLYFYTDQVHWTALLYSILAPIPAAWINANI